MEHIIEQLEEDIENSLSRNLLYRLCVKATELFYHYILKMEKHELHYIAFRVKRSSIEHDTFVKFLHEYGKVFAVSENEQTNHHIQGIVQIRTKNKIIHKSAVDNFRRKMKARNGLVGNKDFSVKECDDNDKYITYLCKGASAKEPPIIFLHNWSNILESEIRLNHNKFWEVNKNLKSTDAHKKYHKIASLELPEKFQKMYLSDKMKWSLKIILYHYNNDLLIPDKYQLDKMITTYQMKTAECPYHFAYVLSQSYYETDNCIL